jgi:membrane-bound lytic murein transglycosylase A
MAFDMPLPLPTLPRASLQALPFAKLPGWQADDHAAALAVLASCAAPPHAEAMVRDAQPMAPLLHSTINKAAALGATSAQEAKVFFEAHFQPFRIVPDDGEGFLTSYFEPEYPASRTRDGAFTAPLLARPADLVTFPVGERAPAPLDPMLAAAQKTAEGLKPFPTRQDIEQGALAGQKLEMAHLHPVDLFFMQVQGSGRLLFDDGSRARFAYAGRNGRPYTSVGKVIVAEGHMTLEGMTLEKLTGWLKAHPDQAERIMRMNESYVFFREVHGLSDEDGPIGGAGWPLTPHRSIAVDRTLFIYGLPFWLDTALPLTLSTSQPLKRLMIAQDTGSAILGPARADYFMGSGAEAGRRAGLVRQKMAFTLLWPKA